MVVAASRCGMARSAAVHYHHRESVTPVTGVQVQVCFTSVCGQVQPLDVGGWGWCKPHAGVLTRAHIRQHSRWLTFESGRKDGIKRGCRHAGCTASKPCQGCFAASPSLRCFPPTHWVRWLHGGLGTSYRYTADVITVCLHCCSCKSRLPSLMTKL
jgi:hypothetical protein